VNSRRVSDFVDSLLRNRRPKRFTPEPEDVDALRATIELNEARTEAARARPEFIDDLHRRLAEQLEDHEVPANATAARVDRRRLIGGIGIAAAAAVAGAVLDRKVLTSDDTPSAPVAQELVPDEGVWTPVVSVSKLAAGDVARFSTTSMVGFVVNDGAHLSAVSGVCTHLGCLLQHNAAEGRLDCPCHRASFSLQGEVLRQQFPEPLRPLPHLAVRERDGQIEINDARPV
jgi:nitrite reductase/ring-hydroxylating ferredoxin subunit